MTSGTRLRLPAKTERSGRGFTLVELLLVVMLMGLLASVAAPRLNRSVRSRELDTAAANLRALVKMGRAEAVRRGLKVRLRVDAKTGEVGLALQLEEHSAREEYGPFKDSVLDAHGTMPDGVSVGGLERGGDLVFEPTGVADARELSVTDRGGRRIPVEVTEWYDDRESAVQR